MPNRFKEACHAISQGSTLIRQRMSETSALGRMATALPERTELDDPSPARDYDRVASTIGEMVRTGRQMSQRDVRDAPWCLWETTPALATDRAVLLSILEAVIRAGRARPYRALAASYATSFRDELPGLDAVAPALSYLAGRWDGTWTELHRRFNFFDPGAGPRRLAQAMIEQDRPVIDILRDQRLGAISERGGYAKAVTAALLRELAAGADLDHLSRLKRVRRFALNDRGAPLFEEQRPQLAEALLRPLVAGSTTKAVRSAFLPVLLSLFGDPRLHPANWTRVSVELRALVTRWLTEQSLRQFLEIVDQIALERMWRYRRAFWESVYEADLISEAWVAFGIDGQRIAKSSAFKGLEFANLYTQGRQVEAGHAVLLMRIGDGVVADWSHNAKCNIWYQASDAKAPHLFGASYGSDTLRIGDGAENRLSGGRVSLSHTSSDTFGWQAKVAHHIYQMTGHRLDPRRWVV